MGAPVGLSAFSLRGQFGLLGWQWMFLVEGSPAVLLSIAVFLHLPERPAKVSWLSDREKGWIETTIAADRAANGPAGDPGLLKTVFSSGFMLLAAASILHLGSSYAFSFSAPRILADVTHLSAMGVGFIVAGVWLAAAAAMLAAGWYSDRSRERHWPTIILLSCMAAAFAIMSWTTNPWLVVFAYALWRPARLPQCRRCFGSFPAKPSMAVPPASASPPWARLE